MQPRFCSRAGGLGFTFQLWKHWRYPIYLEAARNAVKPFSENIINHPQGTMYLWVVAAPVMMGRCFKSAVYMKYLVVPVAMVLGTFDIS